MFTLEGSSHCYEQNRCADYVIYYIVESEILKNTQRDIFHIFTSEDIDHVTFSIYTIFCLGLYNKQNITWWLEGSLRSFVKYCFHHSKIKVISSRRRVISSMYVFSARPFENHLCERLPCLKIINRQI